MTVEELRNIWAELEKAGEAVRNGEPIPALKALGEAPPPPPPLGSLAGM